MHDVATFLGIMARTRFETDPGIPAELRRLRVGAPLPRCFGLPSDDRVGSSCRL